MMFLMVVGGCVRPQQSPRMFTLSHMRVHTGGHTGCRPEEVRMGVVRDNLTANGAAYTPALSQRAVWWQAECHGVRYNCTGQQDQFAVRDVACRPVQSPEARSHPSQHKEGVRTKCDVSDDTHCDPTNERLVGVFSIDTPTAQMRVVLWGYPSRESTSQLVVYRQSSRRVFRSCRNIDLWVGDEKVSLSDSADYTNGQGWEGLKVSIPLSTVERIGDAALKIKLRACASDIVIQPDQSKIISEYAEQWRQLAGDSAASDEQASDDAGTPSTPL